MKANKQDISFWNSKESIVRYAEMHYNLTDLELFYLAKATAHLNKKVSEIKILDLGCGGGRTTVALHKMGYKVIGIDIAPKLISKLKKEWPELDVRVGDAETLSFKDSSFDIVLFSHNSIDYLYPVGARKNAVCEVARVLKFDGVFIFSSHIFNLIPYNIEVLKNILSNMFANPKLLFVGSYYVEHMRSGSKVMTHAGSPATVKRELRSANFDLELWQKAAQKSNSRIITFIHSFLSWEIYYFAKKKEAIDL